MLAKIYGAGAALGFSLLLASPVQAGCANFVDGSLGSDPPSYQICYKDSCEITTLDWECANVTQWSRQFASGWATYCEAPETGDATCEIYWQDRPIASEKYDDISIEPYPVEN
ncbi:hypothetical protein AAD018_010870 [Aestuariibius insulae]|uniref:hypothetical protein n=1 Tax=Aestuariibius insulae TaxID=2058287 RepID=UPI00345E85A1